MYIARVTWLKVAWLGRLPYIYIEDFYLFGSLRVNVHLAWKGSIMARVTVEDCITKIPNRFKLVMLAGKRARDITAGAEIMVDRDDAKNPVVALR